MSRSTDQTRYDIFISYARKDNKPLPGNSKVDGQDAKLVGWVTALRDHILANHREFSTEPLRIFFDTEEIRDMDDWRHRILGALRSSKILLVCLSPNYFASEYCLWEWKEYVTRQVHQLMGSDSFAGVYFVDVPGSIERANAAEFNRWVQSVKPLFDEVTRGNFTDIRPWFSEGAEALQREEVRRRMAALGQSLWERLQRARRAEAAPGNLRRQTPFFVGRREELRRLHEQLGTGAVGVVTAVHGLGGQGKTELAVAYAHAWADCYPGGLWAIGAEGEKELLPLIGELAWDAALGFTPTETQKNDSVLLGRGVLAHLQQRAEAVKERDPDKGAAALILLDNVSDPALLSPAQLATLPRVDWLRLVATTRLEINPIKNTLALLAVDSLDEASGLALLRDHQPPRDSQGNIVVDFAQGVPRFASRAEDDAAREIVCALGGFTLALEQVGVFLGLHPEVAPGDFLAGLKNKGLPTVDSLVEHHPNVAAQMLTQSKQLAIILDATLARLDDPARTAMQFAALLPPDTVPWPWLKSLTIARHPELAHHDPDEPDPWLEIRRRLSGLRFLTPGEHPEVARIHRLVAAHLAEKAESWVAESLGVHLAARAWSIYNTQESPEAWELDALLVAAAHCLAEHPTRDLANASVGFSDKVVIYRSLAPAANLLASAHAVLKRLAASDLGNAGWQRALSVSNERIGDVLRAKGDQTGALATYRASLEIRQRLSSADPGNAGWQRDLSVSRIKIGDVLSEQGDLTAARTSYRASHEIIERLASADSGNAGWQRDLSVSQERIGDVHSEQGDLAAALASYRASLEIRQRLAAADSGNARWQGDLSISHNKIGDVLLSQDLTAALASYQASLEISQRLASADPGNTVWQRDRSISHDKIGDVLRAQGDLIAVLASYRASHEIFERLASADPGNAGWQRDLSVSHDKIGDVLSAQGDLTAALASYRASLEISQWLLSTGPENVVWQRDLSVSQEKIGDVLSAQGDLTAALASYRASLEISQWLLSTGPGNVVWQRDLSVSQEKIGDVLSAQGDLTAALAAYRTSHEIFERLASANSGNAGWQRDLSVSHNKIGDVLSAQGDLTVALASFRASLEIRQRLASIDSGNAGWQRDLSMSQEKIGDVLSAQGDLTAALASYRASLEIRQRLASADPGNAGWQRDLWAGYWRMAALAESNGNGAAPHWWQKAHDVLSSMKQRGLFLSPQDEQYLGTLQKKIGKTK